MDIRINQSCQPSIPQVVGRGQSHLIPNQSQGHHIGDQGHHMNTGQSHHTEGGHDHLTGEDQSHHTEGGQGHPRGGQDHPRGGQDHPRGGRDHLLRIMHIENSTDIHLHKWRGMLYTSI